MNTAKYVDEQIPLLKSSGIPLSEAVWQLALMCVGWPYVFGAWGAYCTPEERRKRYSDSHPTIKSACQVLRDNDPKPSCAGCKWYPENQRVRCYDCRGFTDWCLKQFGIDLAGEGCTSQWNNEKNWQAKGYVKDGIQADTLVCLFYEKKDEPKKMAHTGFGYNGETVECSSGVQHKTAIDKKWTRWAVPAGITDQPEPVPVPEGYAIVTGKKVALRQEASMKATVITRINTGEKVKLEPEPDEWDYVSYKGKKGWMMKKYLDEG